MDDQLCGEFSQLLSDVLSEDNNLRQSAENKISSIPPATQILLHLNTICTSLVSVSSSLLLLIYSGYVYNGTKGSCQKWLLSRFHCG